MIKILLTLLITLCLGQCVPAPAQPHYIDNFDEEHPAPSPTPTPVPKPKPWKHDDEVSWYGPHFYGKRTACGLKLTTKLLGVAHRSLPCGTLVTFKYKDRVITVPVVDRGPYVSGRIWDLTGGACVALKHCFTGPIEYRIGR